MYRLNILLLMLLCSLSATSQNWTAVDSHQYNDETIVYATISNDRGDSPESWMLAAFIDGECRAEAREPSVGVDGSLFFILRVYGDRDADKGKTITFAVCHQTTKQEFDCQSSEPVVFNGESYGEPSAPILLTFTTAEIPLQGFLVSIDPLVAGQTGQLRLTPVPADATFRINGLALTFESLGDLGSWNTLRYELISREPIIYNIVSTVPRQYQLSIGDVPLYLADGVTPFTKFEAAAPLCLKQGWQWRTNCYGNVTATDFERIYGGKALTEIRTEDCLLYNDPAWGYYGTLMEAGLPQNMPYKVLMTTDLNSSLSQGFYTDGYTVTVNDGWTWIPSPYYFDRLLTSAFNPSQLPEGLVIISKERGSAEWDGTEWVGDLQVLPAYESFLCYAETDEPFTLTYKPEANMTPGNDKTPAATPAEARSLNTTPWHYDAAQFRDNMTMVVQLPHLECPADYSIGAFVGGECRGEGHFVTGRHDTTGYFFVTVHCYQGERISFRLYHQPSGQQYSVDQTVTSTGLRLGSLRQPLTFTSNAQVTAITAPEEEWSMENGQHSTFYDLMGRKVSSHRRGLLIEQLPDGTVRRIIR